MERTEDAAELRAAKAERKAKAKALRESLK